MLDNSVVMCDTKDMTNTQTTEKPFVLYTTGPRCWYALEVSTRQIGVGFKTKKAAQAAVDSRNEVRGF